MRSITEQFRAAIQAAGLTPPDIIKADGKLRRFSTNGTRHDDSGWCLLYGDGIPAGCFGDWRSGLSETWRADAGRPLSPTEEAAYRAKLVVMQQKREAEKARRSAEARAKAAVLVKAGTSPSQDNRYLSRKQVSPVETLREIDAAEAAKILGYAPHSSGEQLSGRLLVVPIYVGEVLSSCEFIDSAGRKAAIAGGIKSGGYWAAQPFPVGDGDGMVLLIGEGAATVLSAKEATGHPAIAALSAGNLPAVAKAMQQRYPAASLTILADLVKATGEPHPHAIEAARSVGGLLAVPDFGAQRPDGMTDFNDLAALRGRGAVRRDIAQAVALSRDNPQAEAIAPNGAGGERGEDALRNILKQPMTPPMRYHMRSGQDLADAPPMRWLVAGTLPLEGLAALYGTSGSGKSFLALDLAIALASGASHWFGRRIAQVPVTYIALEGEAGIGKRLKAWTEFHAQPLPDALRFVTQPVDLLNGADADELARAAHAAGGADGLTIVDTLNQSAPGADENGSADMGRIIAVAKQLQRQVGGLVLLIHHAGKDSTRGLRGHSSLYAALDAVIEVSRTGVRREWAVAKSKDDESGKVYPFRLEVVPVGTDDEGDDITSCVALPDDSRESVRHAKPPSGGNQKIAMDALAEPLRTSQEFGKDGAPPGYPSIRLDEAIRMVAERLPCGPKHRIDRARRALTGLAAKQIYGIKGDWLWRI